jgi:hypothetical protein
LQHLRFGATLSGVTLCLALFAQIIVWGFVHFMDVRVQHLGPTAVSGSSLAVVTKAEPPAPAPEEAPKSGGTKGSGRSLIDAPSRKSAEAPVIEAAASEPPAGVEVNIVQARGDLLLSRVASFVQAVGIISALALALLMFQGVMISAGAQAPGVEFCVTASFWGFVIACLCVPMTMVVPGSAFSGVFCSYPVMTAAADGFRHDSPTALGAPGYFGLYLLLPILTACGAAACVLRFRAGVEEGVIVTSINQFDEKIEREIRTSKWNIYNQPRTMGALNKAMGDRVAGPGSGHGSITGMAAGAESMGPGAPGGPGGGGDGPELPPGMALRRPI